jgi:nucleoside-diphosphate-sugar epimerase
MQNIFITGGTGYMGTRLIKALQNGDYHVCALVRKGSENKLPQGCEMITGDALDASSYQNNIEPSSTFVHLVGVAHPSPSKKEQFKTIDLVSVQEAAKAAVYARVAHFIYLSVSQYPTKIMKDFQQVRAAGEALLLQTGLKTSFLRPWYVLGPGHWWPVLLKPFLFIAKYAGKREAAENLDTVTLQQMIHTLLYAIKNPPQKNAVYDVQKIKSLDRTQ